MGYLLTGANADAQMQIVRGAATVGDVTTHFPSTAIGSTSASETIELKTTVTEVIDSITVAVSQGEKKEYVLGKITGCTLGTSSEAGTVCSIPVTFKPAYPGHRRVPLQIVTSAGKINFGLNGIGLGPLAALTPGVMSTYAGSANTAVGDGGPASQARLVLPVALAVDNAGNLYIADTSAYVVRKVNYATGVISTVAGMNGISGYSGDRGPAINAELSNPTGIALDAAGRLYIADQENQVIRRVDMASGIITTVAGEQASTGFVPTGDGGLATKADILQPIGVTLDSIGNLYISSSNAFVVRKVDAVTGIITTVVGDGTHFDKGDGGPALEAGISYSIDLAVDDADNLYLSSTNGNVIRKVNHTTGIITRVAGANYFAYSGDGGPATSATLFYPEGIALDSAANLYISDSINTVVRKISSASQIISTVAGIGDVYGFAGDHGSATIATINQPQAVAVDNAGNLYIADTYNNRVRRVALTQGAVSFPTPTAKGQKDITDSPETLTLYNAGNTALAIEPPANGRNPTVAAFDFTLDAASACPELQYGSTAISLATGATCTYGFDFTPGATGALSETSELTTTASGQTMAPLQITLKGTGRAVTGVLTGSTFVSSKNPSIYGDTVTYTIQVTAKSGTAVPTGSVQIYFDGLPYGSPVKLNSTGIATFADSTPFQHLIATRPHRIYAVYTPASAAFTGSSSTTLVQVVKPLPLTVKIIHSDVIGDNAPVSKVYDGTRTKSLTAGNFVISQNPDEVFFNASLSSGVTGFFSSASAGSQTITASLPMGDFEALGNQGDEYYTFANYVVPAVASGAGLITPAPVAATIVGNPTKVYDGTTKAKLTAANFKLTGFVGTDNATVTQTAGTYASPAVGSELVTASLAAANLVASGTTNLKNYALPATVKGPGTITAAAKH